MKKNDISQSTTAIQEQAEPGKPKNKWLYPTDEFGKMEEGMVYESKTYKSGVRDGENITKFSIKLKHRTTNKGNL